MAWGKVARRKDGSQPGPDAWDYAAGFLLAGGKSSRMGTDKAFLRIEGETLAERALRKLREVCPEVAIAGGSDGLGRFGRLIGDAVADRGPLGGIVSALEQSEFGWNLFLPVDTPFLPAEALHKMLFAAGGGALAYMALVDEEVQPLCAVLSRRILPVLRAELAAGQLRVRRAIEASDSFAYVVFEERGWFRNLNTPDEFESALKQAAEILAPKE